VTLARGVRWHPTTQAYVAPKQAQRVFDKLRDIRLLRLDVYRSINATADSVIRLYKTEVIRRLQSARRGVGSGTGPPGRFRMPVPEIVGFLVARYWAGSTKPSAFGMSPKLAPNHSCLETLSALFCFRMGADMKSTGNDTKLSHLPYLPQDARRDTLVLAGLFVG
jgi:hypothetical protein